MRSFLIFLTIIFFFSFSTLINAEATQSINVQEKLDSLEKDFNGKIGVYAINTDNNQIIAHRADERFPFQSTLKFIGVSALLKQSEKNKNLLNENIHYTKNDLLVWHPITGKYVSTSMTLAGLSEAAISYSDNPAINLIIKKLGGPESITQFAHSIGNQTFNVEHYDGDLNSNPNVKTDTVTPKDMAVSLEKIALGNVLTPAHRKQLVTWMTNNTTGYKRIRSGVPIGWTVADKTGSGDYGIANDIAVLWSPLCKPIILVVYTNQSDQHAKGRDDIVASTTKIVMDEFAKNDRCFKELFS